MVRFFAFSFIYFFSFFLSASENNELNYFIKFDHLKKGCLTIRSSIPTNQRGEITIKFPPKGISSFNVSPHFIDAQDISAFSKKFVFKETRNAIFEYDLCMSNSEYHADFPVINSGYVYLLPLTSFIIPQDDLVKKRDIKIFLKNPPENFKFISSQGPLEEELSFSCRLNDFLTFVLIGTKHKINSDRLNGRSIFSIHANKKKQLSRKNREKIKDIILFQEALFKNKSDEPLLLNFMSSKSTPYLFARNFNNTLVLTAPFYEKEDVLIRAFSHEHFHNWIGIKLRASDLNSLLWFIEGIDDYFGLVTAYKAKALSGLEYINNVNQLLRHYYLSPLSKLSYGDLIKNSKIDFHHSQIIQMRGHLLGMILQDADQPEVAKYSLAKMLNIIIQDVNSEYLVLTPKSVEDYFIQAFSKSKWLKIKYFLDTGDGLDLPSQLDKLPFRLTNVKVHAPKYGFNLKSFFEERKIQCLDLKSIAYQAGLRNGMEVLEYNLRLSEPHQKVKIIVKDTDGTKMIEFTPDSEFTVVPQYISAWNR
ncbi:MAG: hypothetical protein U1E78_08405 [Gammaproteobacteria bacterium]